MGPTPLGIQDVQRPMPLQGRGEVRLCLEQMVTMPASVFLSGCDDGF